MNFANFGIDLAIVGGIIGLTEVIKSILPESIKRYVIILPTVLGAAAALIVGWGLGWQVLAKNIILYVGAATYIWRFGKTVIAGQ